jgi:hypothetical protein
MGNTKSTPIKITPTVRRLIDSFKEIDGNMSARRWLEQLNQPQNTEILRIWLKSGTAIYKRHHYYVYNGKINLLLSNFRCL